MTDYPITPPPELVEQWHSNSPLDRGLTIATRAAQWGADTELEACCEVLARELICDGKHVATDLRMIRRPKPPSLKKQALEAARIELDPKGKNGSLILRALEQLPD
jgi:hypothetical protein